jgi:hypothetical protein
MSLVCRCSFFVLISVLDLKKRKMNSPIVKDKMNIKTSTRGTRMKEMRKKSRRISQLSS